MKMIWIFGAITMPIILGLTILLLLFSWFNHFTQQLATQCQEVLWHWQIADWAREGCRRLIISPSYQEDWEQYFQLWPTLEVRLEQQMIHITDTKSQWQFELNCHNSRIHAKHSLSF